MKAINAYSVLSEKTLKEQFKKLILQSLSEIKLASVQSSRQIIIVIR